MGTFFYKVNDKEYPVVIVKKNIKNIHYRFRDGTFVISSPYLVREKQILKGLDKYASKMIERSEETHPSEGEDFIYIFGKKVPVEESGVIHFSNGEDITYKNRLELDRKIKKLFLNYVTLKTEYYAKLMNLPVYQVKVRNSKTRFGSNSKYSKTINYSTMLIPFSSEIIDSVIVHELAHILVYNHSPKFYDIVYKYCPNYDSCRKKLIKRIYQ